ncbi:MAG: hypothetical protein JW789_00215 [Candidatus Aenigmarchaeota archaeon]|nr:hypothetical protein [Candidatus Aenigmarchaeota archaeon]
MTDYTSGSWTGKCMDYLFDTKAGRYIILTGLGLLAATQIAAAQQDTLTVSNKKGTKEYRILNDGKTVEALEIYTGMKKGDVDVFLNQNDRSDTIQYPNVWKPKNQNDLFFAAKDADKNKDGIITWEEARTIYKNARINKLNGGN